MTEEHQLPSCEEIEARMTAALAGNPVLLELMRQLDALLAGERLHG